MKKIRIELTRKQAEELGLLICKCGWSRNNHFDFDKKICAHNYKCKGYKEKAKVGKLL